MGTCMFPAFTRMSASGRSALATARCILLFAMASLGVCAHSIGSALAQPYPTRPVHIVVGFAAGGPNDILARLVAQWLSVRLGQPFVVDNRPGASSNVGTEAVVRAAPDGHTLLLVGASNAINATLYDNLNFIFLRDIAPVAGLMRVPLVLLTSQSFPARTIPELIAYARTNPGAINMASGGIGNPSHVAGELFKMMTGVNMVHVPYRGAAPALTDLLAGRVQIYFGTPFESMTYIKAGTLHPLAVTTASRCQALPDVPTVGEFVPGYEASAFYGIGAPRNTPAEIVEKLNEEINAGLGDTNSNALFAEMGATSIPGSPADFGKLIAEETEKWSRVVRFTGATLE
jgi:tripartite-type tricarboxylate transporter receptor subunit TctC